MVFLSLTNGVPLPSDGLGQSFSHVNVEQGCSRLRPMCSLSGRPRVPASAPADSLQAPVPPPFKGASLNQDLGLGL